MFTDVRLGSEVDVSELKPGTQLKKFKTVESALPSGRGKLKSTPRWHPGKLPPGFELAVHRSIEEPGSSVYEHLVYSDGLAAVSVYIEGGKAERIQRTGLKKLGTTHAFSRQSDDMLVTVVGDVPAITVQMIGDGVETGSP
jgi:sigma-E factor negative regulatory protein RseB